MAEDEANPPPALMPLPSHGQEGNGEEEEDGGGLGGEPTSITKLEQNMSDLQVKEGQQALQETGTSADDYPPEPPGVVGGGGEDSSILKGMSSLEFDAGGLSFLAGQGSSLGGVAGGEGGSGGGYVLPVSLSCVCLGGDMPYESIHPPTHPCTSSLHTCRLDRPVSGVSDMSSLVGYVRFFLFPFFVFVCGSSLHPPTHPPLPYT